MAASLVRKFSGALAKNIFYQTSKSTSTNLASQCAQSLRGTTQALCRPLQRSFSCWTNYAQPRATAYTPQKSSNLLQVCQPMVSSVRTAVRYSIRKGKPKTVKAVVNRFFRLPWGIYIRTRAGRHRKKYAKPDWINERAKYHVFCNKTQSRMFDKMVTQQWKRRRHYVNDPYEPYMKRTGMEYTPPKFLP